MNFQEKYDEYKQKNIVIHIILIQQYLNKYIINNKYIKSSTKPIQIAKNNLEKLQQNIDFKAKI